MNDLSGGGPRLRTDRLDLRRPAVTDVDAVHAIHSDPRTCVHNPSDALATPEEAEELYHRWDAHWRRHGYGYWVVRRHDDPAPLGFCGIKHMDLRGMDVLNLFYRFAAAAWGRGYAGEAAAAVTAWAARNVPGLPLIARVRPANVASGRVAVRAGLTRAEHLDGDGYDGFDQIYATRLPDRE
ncbi:GNAT family N-acetyltransferase [Nonomuraea indica]|uniref:GNAT family N-acetyltransferase n=1 Tax=Nonomuraea indica TaxID=1581193 RepID=A0ABW8A606_9ACTN|nr:GNAT family N-acetyltransferase [Nonomuraea indica]